MQKENIELTKENVHSKRHRDILQGKFSQGNFSNWIRGRQGWVSFLLEPSTNYV